MAKLLSNKVRKVPSGQADPNRFQFISLENTEPDLGLPTSNGQILVSNIDGTREWTNDIQVEAIAIDSLIVNFDTELNGNTVINGNIFVNGVNTQTIGSETELIEEFFGQNITTQNLSVLESSLFTGNTLFNGDVLFTGNVVIDDLIVTNPIDGQVGDISNHTTDDLTEGNINLYFTQERVRDSLSAFGDLDYDANTGEFSVTTYKSTDFDNDFSEKDTDELAEGNTNLYFTEERVRNSLSANGDLNYDPSIGEFSIVLPELYNSNNFNDDFGTKTTNDLAEGANNLYFTEERVRDSLSASGDLDYDANTGQFSVTTYKSEDFDIDFATKDTDDLIEGNTNLYFTEERTRQSLSASGDLNYDANNGQFSVTTYKSTDFDTDFESKNTDDLDEGNTNLYFTEERVRDSLSASGDLDYNSNTGEFSVTTYKSTDFDTDFSAKNTDDLTEGNTNLYFTEERVRDSLSANDGIVYSSNSGQFSVDSTVVRTSGDQTVQGIKTFNDIEVDRIQFDTGGHELDGPGQMAWDDLDQALTYRTNGIIVDIGQENLVYVRNPAGGNTIPIGSAVAILGASANRLTVVPCDSTVGGDGCRTLGVSLSNIESPGFGFVSTFGLIRNFDTGSIIGGNVVEGAELFISSTPGALSTQPQPSPGRRVTVGYVVTTGTNGSIFVTIRRGQTVDELDNVLAENPQDGQILAYNNTASRYELTTLDTDFVDEGNTNLYFTEERVRNSLSANGDLNYNSNTGVFSVTTYKSSDFDTDFNSKSTDDLAEGNTNLYFIEAPTDGEQYVRKDGEWEVVSVADTTDELAEGNTNLYFTEERVRDSLSASGDLNYDPSNGNFSVTTYKSTDFDDDFAAKNTDDLDEGNTNLYFTESRVRNSLSASGDLVYNPSNGNFSVSTYKITDFNLDFASKNTDELDEGNTNLYFSTSRVDDHLSGANSVQYNAGVISLPQPVDTNANVTFNNITLTGTVTLGKDPLSPDSAATKRYVDEVAQGLQARTAAQVLVDTNLSATLDPDGFANNHATLTSTSNGAFPTTDGIDSDDLNIAGIRILLISQTDAEQNGLWVVLQPGDTNNPWVLRRCKDCRTSQQVPGSFVFVEIGNTFGGTGWVLIVENPSTFEIDVDPIFVVQFSGAGTFVAGTGLTLDGNEFRVNANLNHVTTVGTLVGGTWQANIIDSVYGGTGVNNGGRTITVNTGNVAFTTAAGGSAVTVPASGTLATVANITQRIEKKTTTVATTSAINIDTFDKTQNKAAKYIVSINQGTDFRTSEILVAHNNANNSVLTEYAILSSNLQIAEFSTDISGDNVRLRVTMGSATSANVELVKIPV